MIFIKKKPGTARGGAPLKVQKKKVFLIGKRTPLLQLYQLCSAKQYPKGYAEGSKTILPNWKQRKTHLSQQKTSKNEKLREENHFFEKCLRYDAYCRKP